MTWTEGMIEQLKRLRADGYSCSECAKEIGHGITKNAVIGKLGRLNMPYRDPRTRKQRLRGARVRHRTKDEVRLDSSLSNKLRWAKARKERSADQRKSVKPPSEAPEGHEVSFFASTSNHCKFITEEADRYGPDSMCCGAPVVEGTSWCSFHRAVVWVPPKERRALPESSGSFELAEVA